jgi:ABC-type phosphate transport system substrate-binding protein
MRLKSPVRLPRGLTTLVTTGTVILGFAGFAVISGGSASADPHQVYTVVGSDTVENVYDQFALDEGANLIGSWDAVDPVSQAIGEIITPNNAAGGQCEFTRPDGSGQGENALRASINPSTTASQLAVPPEANCVDWSRSSSGPGTDQKDDGVLVFIPFAIDAVTGGISTAATSAFTTETNLLTSTQLTDLYDMCENVTMPDGSILNPNGNATGTQIPITLYLPQSGSGTAKFWASKTGGWSATAPATCVHQTIQAGPDMGDVVEENDGTEVTSDPTGYMPFSTAQWISQNDGCNKAPACGTDRLHSLVLTDINSIAPIVNGEMNLNQAFTREVYDIIPYANVTSGMTGYNAQEAELLAGTTSVLCRDVITITNFGFALLPSNSTVYDACGATTENLRAFDSTDPV